MTVRQTAGTNGAARRRDQVMVSPTERVRPVIDGAPIVPSRIPSTSSLHEPWALTEEQRESFRVRARAARASKAAALRGDGPSPIHDINVPALDPSSLMPLQPSNGLRSLSLFSGGGGLDLGFERAGYGHVGAYEILEDAAATLVKARPDWLVFGGEAGDVRHASWRGWRGEVEVLHGGPPCQPFSLAGRQRGESDPRDMWPEFVRAVREVRPTAFVAENVPALAGRKFADYVTDRILAPLASQYVIHRLILRAPDYGIPQIRRRVFFVGFRGKRAAKRFQPPAPTHAWPADEAVRGLPRCMGMREALGLPDLGFDDLSPTIRSTLNGPRNTTSILNSVSAKRKFERLQVWPNGVAPAREQARRFVVANGHFRLAVPDVAVLQGFPQDWPFVGATYMALGQIGNAVPPPLGYSVAVAVASALGAR